MGSAGEEECAWGQVGCHPQQPHPLPVTCSHHCLPTLVLVPMPGVMAKSWLPAARSREETRPPDTWGIL